MMKWNTVLSIVLAATLATGAWCQDDLLGKKRGGGSSGGSSSGSSSGGTKGSGPASGGIKNPGGSSGHSGGKIAPPPQPTRPRIDSGSSGQSGGTLANPGWTRSDAPVRVERPQSRSGKVEYKTQSNLNANMNRADPVQIRNFPNWTSSASREASREKVKVHTYRRGYHMYDPYWRDSYFSYPYYQFSYSNGCVPSPWYLYPHLPAYVVTNRVSFTISLGSFRFDTRYHWQNRDRYDRNSDAYELDLAIKDLVTAFERADTRILDTLIPRRGSVVISNDRERSYTLSSDDFYDMMVDAVRGTRTSRYRIIEVRRGRDGAYVVAGHEFTDTWGRRETLYHYYSLRAERRGYEIVEFGTSYRAP